MMVELARVASITHAGFVAAAFAFATLAGSPGHAAVSAADAKQGIIECTSADLKKHNLDLAGKAGIVSCAFKPT